MTYSRSAHTGANDTLAFAAPVVVKLEPAGGEGSTATVRGRLRANE
jgi:hypothetical protein